MVCVVLLSLWLPVLLMSSLLLLVISLMLFHGLVIVGVAIAFGCYYC